MSLVANETPLSATVKAATATLHTELENLLNPKLSSIESNEDYAALLKMFYGFYQPLENNILRHIDTAILPDISDRCKTVLLQQDLIALDQNIRDVPVCHALPQITNVATAFGAMYVLEGSTLGGRIITRMLAQNAAVPSVALHFFSGYHEATGSRWKTFLHALNSQANEGEVVAGANATFLHLKNWIQKTF